MKQTVIFDFDGVIHSYSSKWKGATVIPDPPVEGIKESIAEIRKEYRVVVVSSRCYQPGGIEAIKKYLEKYEIEVDDVTGTKPAAVVSIDDRGLTFDGHPETLLNKIKTFIPWNKKERT
jgi:beta-phosphoglucomutase-like phosphatase (HAD superfamily)